MATGREAFTAFGLKTPELHMEHPSLTYGSSGHAINTSTYRSCGAAYSVNAAGEYGKFIVPTPIADWGVYQTIYCQFSSVPATGYNILLTASANAGALAHVRFSSDGKLSLWDGVASSQIGSSSATIPLNTWIRVDFFCLGQASGSSDKAALRWALASDEVTILVAEDTGSDRGWDRFDDCTFGCNSSSTFTGAHTVLIDSYACNIDYLDGRNESSYPGPEMYYFLLPTSDDETIGGTPAQWKLGDNTQPTPRNYYLSLQNLPPTGKATGSAAATDQIHHKASTVEAVYLNMQDYAAAGIKSDAIIKGVQMVLNTGSSSRTITTGQMRILLNPATDPFGSDAFVWDAGATAGTWPTGWKCLRGTWIQPVQNATSSTPFPNGWTGVGNSPRVFVYKDQATTRAAYLCACGMYVVVDPRIEKRVKKTNVGASQAIKRASRW